MHENHPLKSQHLKNTLGFRERSVWDFVLDVPTHRIGLLVLIDVDLAVTTERRRQGGWRTRITIPIREYFFPSHFSPSQSLEFFEEPLWGVSVGPHRTTCQQLPILNCTIIWDRVFIRIGYSRDHRRLKILK
jgi:hypothetical protein